MSLTGSHDRALGVALIWMSGVVLVALVDGWYAQSSAKHVWRREHDPKLSLGVWNPIRLTVENRSKRRMTLKVRDAVPAFMLSRGDSAEGVCPAGDRWDLSYQVFPLHRGDYSFGNPGIRALGPLGLLWVQYAEPLEGAVQVYPDLVAVRTYESLVHRGRLEELGLRSSRRWGMGTEFERLRDYSPDDEFRRINWKATARRARPISVDFQTERSQNIMLVIDAGRLMSTRVPLPSAIEGAEGPAGSPALTRLDYALNASLLLAFVSQRYGDRVGLLAFSDRVTRFVSPAPGQRQFLQLTRAMYNLEPEPTEADYSTGLGYLGVHNRRRSLAVVFTDIAERGAADSLIANIAHLARRHLVMVVTLRDTGVEELATAEPDSIKRVYERAVAQSLLDTREQTLGHLRRRGALTLDVPADHISASVINRYLEIKAKTLL